MSAVLDAHDREPMPRSAVAFALDLERFGDRVALIDQAGDQLSYRQLAARADAIGARLGTQRRLVVAMVSNTVDSIAGYLAALRGGHPVVLVGDGDARHLDAIVSRYDPDVVMSTGPGGIDIDIRAPRPAHTLHPDLALLLSTSGSTGSPKLVRLSAENLQSNAEAIATYLEISDTDRAATTLPMQYCYGLSVINSHLVRGAALLVSSLSVVDRCFWSQFSRHGGTSFAGVPHTFELLDRLGFDSMHLPSLRHVTQAGGRLDPDRVRHLDELSRRQGWRFYVMYGQTEATARMAYLPPDRTADAPSAIGVPIPGGSFEIDSADGSGSGELVYRGPNVMLGYAETASDLALGATVERLRTGDLARRTPDGLYEIVGRASRFIKPFGIRVDLDRLEALLAEDGQAAMCTGDDCRVVIGLDGAGDAPAAAELVRQRLGLPAQAVVTVVFDELPRLASGKPDHATVRAAGCRAAGATTAATLDAIFADVAGDLPVSDDSTFVSLGGDSLGYVETSVRLEQALGFLPDAWHTTPLGTLKQLEVSRRAVPRVETSVVLRAMAIVLVVGSHIGTFSLAGGAHVLLAVAGWNFARFRLTALDVPDRSRHVARSIARIAVPTVAYTAVLSVFTDGVIVTNLALVDNYLGDDVWRFWYWFVEALVQILVIAAIVFSSSTVRRIERRAPFVFAAMVVVGALVLRLVTVGDPANQIYRTHSVLWLFALGWAAQRARTAWQRGVISGLVLVAVPGFFATTPRDLLVVAGLLLLVWLPHVPVPRWGNRAVALLAGASLYIYLTHWQVFPVLVPHLGLWAVTAVTLAAGVGVWLLVEGATASIGTRLRPRDSTPAPLRAPEEARTPAGSPRRSRA